MEKSLQEVIIDIFNYYDVIVEKSGDSALYLAPPDVAELLCIPEEGLLNFSSSDFSPDTVPATYESELFISLKKLFSEKGRLSQASYPSSDLNAEKFSKKISEKISFSNAVFNFTQKEKREVYYLLVYFKYTAMSDEKREGILPVLINEMTFSVLPLEENNYDILEELSEPGEKIKDREKLITPIFSASSSVSILVKEKIGDYLKSLERRLNRDIRRVNEYYNTLKVETKKSIEKKIQKDEEIDKLSDKLDAIEAEKKWKINDLISKYTLNIRIEPLTVIRIKTVTDIFWIKIKRRLSTRQVPLCYNPVLKHLEPLPCESCFYPGGDSYVCDDKLHIVCSLCFAKCAGCGKQYCRACHKDACPKCHQTYL
jgi:hypothetical protein